MPDSRILLKLYESAAVDDDYVHCITASSLSFSLSHSHKTLPNTYFKLGHVLMDVLRKESYKHIQQVDR